MGGAGAGGGCVQTQATKTFAPGSTSDEADNVASVPSIQVPYGHATKERYVRVMDAASIVLSV